MTASPLFDSHLVPFASTRCIEDSPPGGYVEWFPSAQPLVERALAAARVGRGDLVIDLGSGDGRIALTAARRFGARAIGIEIDPGMVEASRLRAAEQGVGERVRFVEADLFASDFSRATVLTLYLLPDMNARLKPKILAMKPGTRVIAFQFGMDDWEPEATIAGGDCRAYLLAVPPPRNRVP